MSSFPERNHTLKQINFFAESLCIIPAAIATVSCNEFFFVWFQSIARHTYFGNGSSIVLRTITINFSLCPRQRGPHLYWNWREICRSNWRRLEILEHHFLRPLQFQMLSTNALRLCFSVTLTVHPRSGARLSNPAHPATPDMDGLSSATTLPRTLSSRAYTPKKIGTMYHDYCPGRTQTFPDTAKVGTSD